MGKAAIADDDPLAVGVVGYRRGHSTMTRDICEVGDVLLVGTRTNDNGTDGRTLFPSDAAMLPRVVELDVIADPFGYSLATDWETSQHLHKALGRQQIADMRANCRAAFEALRAPDFVLQSRNTFAAAAAGGTVSR